MNCTDRNDYHRITPKPRITKAWGDLSFEGSSGDGSTYGWSISGCFGGNSRGPLSVIYDDLSWFRWASVEQIPT